MGRETRQGIRSGIGDGGRAMESRAREREELEIREARMGWERKWMSVEGKTII